MAHLFSESSLFWVKQMSGQSKYVAHATMHAILQRFNSALVILILDRVFPFDLETFWRILVSVDVVKFSSSNAFIYYSSQCCLVSWTLGLFAINKEYANEYTLAAKVMESLLRNAKWHLREFDRHLLFLVVCSRAERNTADFIDPLRNQIEWPNIVSIVWGPLRLKRRKMSIQG